MSIVIDPRLVAKDDRIVVAVSGGIDSMVLLDLLVRLRAARRLTLVVAHVDHQKRPAAAADAEFVAERAQEYGVPCEIMKLDTAGTGNFHDRARKARYAFFREVARRHGANKIALAHQADDQAETILMRLVRGAGFAGYAGMPAVSATDGITIVRPLLGVSRAAIERYQTECGLAFRADSSNAEDHYTRNRFRHRVMPELARENPRYLEKFSQFAAYAEEAHAVVARLADAFLKEAGVTKADIRFPASRYRQLEPAVRKEAVKRCFDLLTDDALELAYRQILTIDRIVCAERPHASCDLPGGTVVIRDYDMVAFTSKRPETIVYDVQISDFGTFRLPDGAVVSVSRKPASDDGIFIELCYNSLDFIFPMRVRTRQDGDRIAFAYGTKKLKDLYIDRKVPMAERDRMPVLAGPDGRILWIPDLRIRAAVPAGTEKIYVTYTREKA